MELRLHRTDVLTTTLSSLCNLLTNCNGDLKLKTDTASDLTADYINDVATSLQKRHEEEYLSMQVELYSSDDHKKGLPPEDRQHENLFNDLWKHVEGTSNAPQLLTVLKDLKVLGKGSDGIDSARRWRNMSKILQMSRAFSNTQLQKAVDELKPAEQEPSSVVMYPILSEQPTGVWDSNTVTFHEQHNIIQHPPINIPQSSHQSNAVISGVYLTENVPPAITVNAQNQLQQNGMLVIADNMQMQNNGAPHVPVTQNSLQPDLHSMVVPTDGLQSPQHAVQATASYPELSLPSTTTEFPIANMISTPEPQTNAQQVATKELDAQSTTSTVIEEAPVEVKPEVKVKVRARRGRKPRGLPVDPFKIGKITVDLIERSVGEKKIKYTLNIQSTIHKRSAKKFRCLLCTVSCNKVIGIKRHNASEHSLPYTCSKDGLGFASKADFRDHMAVHGKVYQKRTKRISSVDPGNHECEICKKIFMHVHTLKAHMKIHQGIRHTCEVCGKLFKHIYNMRVHMFEHTGGCKYECKVCNKMLPTRSLLRKHSIKHQDVKPYSCSICSKAFPLPWRLKKHMQIHNPVKSFICQLCNKAFVRQDNLNQHLKTHNKDPNKPAKPRQRKPPVVNEPPPPPQVQQVQQLHQMTTMPQMTHQVQQLQTMQVEQVQDPQMIHQLTLQQHQQLQQQEQQRQMLETHIQGQVMPGTVVTGVPGLPEGHRVIQLEPHQQQQMQRTDNWDFTTGQFRSVFPSLPGFPGYQ